MRKLYGLVGEKLSHSFSPQIHQFVFQQIGIDAGYFLFSLLREELGLALDGLKLLGAKGINVTIPFKTDIMPMLDWIEPEARFIGAVNTITFEGGKMSGYNTDYKGFGYSLTRHGIEVAGKTAVVLGTGGAAKTVACYLKDHGVSDLHLISRKATPDGSQTPMWSYDELARQSADILVNCTPVGMYPNVQDVILDRRVVAKFEAVVDLIYNPVETRLLADARSMGGKTCNGLSMLIAQAVYAEEIWQGHSIEMALMEPLYSSLNETFTHGKPA